MTVVLNHILASHRGPSNGALDTVDHDGRWSCRRLDELTDGADMVLLTNILFGSI